ncbi:MAG: penicillin-binding protein 1C, partial [Candidatus Adiutrix sp.]|nr:penicillin-binding protein 1C [Candidatus Adiutrix sp.]
LAGSWLVIPAPPQATDFAVSPMLLDRDGRIFHARLSADGEWLLPVPLTEMGRWLPLAAVAIEDKRFWSHPGVDPLALGRALAQNIMNGRVVSGASTITVQTARLARPRKRNLVSKYVEFIEALKLERRLTKDEILEIYLNRAPFGGNLRGAEAAARFYFDKKARDLSLGESALLVALLRGPALYRPDRNPALAAARRDLVLNLLEAKGVISAAEALRAKAEPVEARRGRMPRQAWHLAEAIFNETGATGPDVPDAPEEKWRWGRPGRAYGLPTSLDPQMQAALENRLARALANFPDRVTGAGAVMAHETGEILAYVGNARWTGTSDASDAAGAADGRWVDCARAARSPGSTLKPFIYLAAFANNGLTPASLLADTPLELGGQAPRNFDKRYRGPVSAALALGDSLNAPAVRVLRLAGEAAAVDILRRSGFKYLRPDGRYGDSLILGGCEANLLQMLEAYGALARLGTSRPPDWRPGGGRAAARRVFSEGAAWLTNESLKDDSRLPPGLRFSRPDDASPALAFKTGTSHGLRDAWLAAFTPDHTLVLWLGDPRGAAHPGLTALSALGPVAAPLADDLRRISEANGRATGRWPDRPASVESYRACAVSGQPLGPYCPAERQAFRLKAGAKTHPCRIHALKRGRLVSLWPPELAGWMEGGPGAAGTPGTSGAAAASGTSGARSGPVITSPLTGGLILLDEPRGSLPLRCEGAEGLVHWFVDEVHQASVPADLTPTLALSPGQHRVSLVDARGRTAGLDFSVKLRRDMDRDRDLPLLAFQ